MAVGVGGRGLDMNGGPHASVDDMGEAGGGDEPSISVDAASASVAPARKLPSRRLMMVEGARWSSVAWLADVEGS